MLLVTANHLKQEKQGVRFRSLQVSAMNDQVRDGFLALCSYYRRIKPHVVRSVTEPLEQQLSEDADFTLKKSINAPILRQEE